MQVMPKGGAGRISQVDDFLIRPFLAYDLLIITNLSSVCFGCPIGVVSEQYG